MTGARLWQRAARGVVGYFQKIGHFSINIRLLFLSSVLSGIAQGMFGVNFNLYILSLGIQPDGLGRILSAGPFAHAIAAIPIGFLGEFFGFRAAFILIYSIAGLAQLAQVATGNAYVIATGAFVGGLALAGNFVIGMPFMATNSSAADRAHVFSINSLLFSLTLAAGSLLGGYLPNLLARFTADLTLQYRYTLFIAGIFTIVSIVPICFIAPQVRRHERKISLKPYLWGIDSLTVKSAGIELFIGLTLGLIVPFMNLYFIFHLNTSREFFSTVEALTIVFTSLAAALGPVLAQKLGDARAIALGRWLVPISTVTMALATSAAVGSGGYWGYRALFTMSQWLWLAYAMGAASAKAKVAMSAWLEITFWLGQALAAIITGSLLAKSNYVLPFFLSTAAALITAVLTQMFFGLRLGPKTAAEAGEVA
jgi:hypothetical protein